MQVGIEGDHRLVAREREQAELRQVIANAIRGCGELALLAGGAGVGETRLAQETLANSELLVIASAADRATMGMACRSGTPALIRTP